MVCQKCKNVIPDGSAYCNKCGARQAVPDHKRKPKQRGNGQGTAYKRGNKWACQYRHFYGGRLISIYKGGFATKKEALDYLSTINTVSRTPNAISFEQLYSKWIQRHSGRVSKSTIDCYKSAFKHFAKIHFMPFAMLTTEQLQVCVDECSAGVRTRENMKALCTCLYSYAHEIGVTSEDYGKHIYIDRKGALHADIGKRAFTREELKALAEAHSAGVETADIVLVLCYTGFRINELLKLTKESYCPAGQYLVGGGKTKAGTNRIVTLSPKILSIVEARYNAAEKGAALFSDKNGGHLSAGKYRDMQRKCLASLGLRDLTPHECRHTFATLMKSVEANKDDKMRLIGHADDKMLRHYTHAEITDLKKITDLL